MPEHTACKCGQRYSPQDYLACDSAACPKCGQSLCLATCACGKHLTDAHRERGAMDTVGVVRSVAEFKCPDCGKLVVVAMSSRSNRFTLAVSAAIGAGVIGAGVAWWQGCSGGLVLLAGGGLAILGFASFYVRDLFPMGRM